MPTNIFLPLKIKIGIIKRKYLPEFNQASIQLKFKNKTVKNFTERPD